MTLPGPILSTAFTDGELVNEAKLYARVFQVINAIITWGAAVNIATPVIGQMAANANTDASGFLTVTHGHGFTPSAVFAQSMLNGGTVAVQPFVTDTYTSTTFRVRFFGVSSIAAAKIQWIAFR